MLRGPDLNHWKGVANISAIDCDFVLMKATGGNNYVDDTCDPQVEQAIALNKKGVFITTSMMDTLKMTQRWKLNGS